METTRNSSMENRSLGGDTRQPTRRNFLRTMAGSAAASAAVFFQSDPETLDDSDKTSESSAWFLRDDPAWVNQLSKPKYEVEFEFNSKCVPMRDGVMLAANIWRPKA